MKVNGSRLRIVTGTGRIPVVDIDTGETKDLMFLPGTIIQMATGQEGVEESALVYESGSCPIEHKDRLDNDQVEVAYYQWKKAIFREVLADV